MSEDTALAPLDPGCVPGLLEQPHHYCMAVFSIPTLDFLQPFMVRLERYDALRTKEQIRV